MRRKSFFKEVENLVLNFIPVTKTPALISVHSFQTACVFTARDAVANADLTECCQYTREETAHALLKTMLGCVPLPTPPKQRAAQRLEMGWGRGLGARDAFSR